MRWTVQVHKRAVRTLDTLPERDREAIEGALIGLEADPHPAGSRPLQGYRGLFRVRVGDYRLVYTLQRGKPLVLVILIGHRREIYQLLKRLTG